MIEVERVVGQRFTRNVGERLAVEAPDHVRQRPASRVFAGANLLLGGSTDLVEHAPGVKSGDLSGIAAATVPRWARPFAFPPPGIARLTDWTEKMARLADAVPRAADIRSTLETADY